MVMERVKWNILFKIVEEVLKKFRNVALRTKRSEMSHSINPSIAAGDQDKTEQLARKAICTAQNCSISFAKLDYLDGHEKRKVRCDLWWRI